jgi:hypothetical protein
MPPWILAKHVQKTDKLPEYFHGVPKSPVVLGYTLATIVLSLKALP